MTQTATRTATRTPVPSADLSIVKTVVLNGDGTLTFTLRAANAGPIAAQGVTVKDTLSDRVSFVSAATTKGVCLYDAGHLRMTCSLGALSSGAAATITIRALIKKYEDFDNTARVSSSTNDPNSGNDSGKVRVHFP